MNGTRKKTLFLIAAIATASLLLLTAYQFRKSRTRVFSYTYTDMIRSETRRLAVALDWYFTDFKPYVDVESLNTMTDEQIAELLGDAALKSDGLVDFTVLDGGKRKVVLDPYERMYRVRVKPSGQLVSDRLLWKHYQIYFWSRTRAETASEDHRNWRLFGPYEMSTAVATNAPWHANR